MTGRDRRPPLRHEIGGGAEAGGIYRPLPADDPRQRRPDITLARKHLKWEPTIALEEGLQRTIAYFRTQI